MTGSSREQGVRDLLSDVDAEKVELTLWESSRFITAAFDFGLSKLVVTWGAAWALAGASALSTSYGLAVVPQTALRPLAVAYLSLASALLGIVLAGLAVVAAFFDPSYSARLARVGSLRDSLFMFWWVAAEAVLAITAALALIILPTVTNVQAVVAGALGLATLLFFMALFEALGLVGNIMRHGLYRAALHRPSEEARR